MNIKEVRRLTEQAKETKAKEKRNEDETRWELARVEAESIFQEVFKTVSNQIEKAAKQGCNSTSIWHRTEGNEYTGRVNYLVAEKLSEHLKAEGYAVKVSVDKNFKHSDDSCEEPLTRVVVSW